MPNVEINPELAGATSGLLSTLGGANALGGGQIAHPHSRTARVGAQGDTDIHHLKDGEIILEVGNEVTTKETLLGLNS